MLPNGNVLLVVARPDTTILREIDLAGNTIREMDNATLGQKISNAGFDFVPNSYHHELLPLANGHLLVLVGFPAPSLTLRDIPALSTSWVTASSISTKIGIRCGRGTPL